MPSCAMRASSSFQPSKSGYRVEELLPETGVYLDTAFALGRIAPLGDGYYGPSDLPLMEVSQFVRMVRKFPGRLEPSTCSTSAQIWMVSAWS